MLGRKRIRNERCLSAASFVHFPFFDLHKREPEGQRSAVAFFGKPFLAKQERFVAAGLPPACNLKAPMELGNTYGLRLAQAEIQKLSCAKLANYDAARSERARFPPTRELRWVIRNIFQAD